MVSYINLVVLIHLNKGVAERKHRHIVDTTRTLLVNANVPLKFWGDAVLTAGYLINRMSSSVLNNQVPHSLLYPTEPLYVVVEAKSVINFKDNKL